MPEKLITIARFSHPIEAHLSKTRLESAGIQCFIADENIVGANWLYSNAVGGVKLRVRASDVKRAIGILRQGPVSSYSEGDTVDENEKRCPKCNSLDVYYENYARRLVYVSWLLLGFPIPFLRRRWNCGKCRYQWKSR